MADRRSLPDHPDHSRGRLLLQPLLDGIIFGIFFAYVTRPIKNFLSKYTRFAPLIATSCIVLPVLVIFLLTAIELKNQVRLAVCPQDEVIAQVERRRWHRSTSPPGSYRR